jgi:predicted protein tyrosine phosphatase
VTAPASYWVVHGRLLAGEYPGSSENAGARARIASLVVGKGVSFFMDLTERGENGLRPYANLLEGTCGRNGIPVAYDRIPVPDYEAPSSQQMVRILDTIDDAILAGHVVYLHCHMGIGRTGTVVGCYLVRRGRRGHEALDIADQRRIRATDSRHSLASKQRAMVLAWRAGG